MLSSLGMKGKFAVQIAAKVRVKEIESRMIYSNLIHSFQTLSTINHPETIFHIFEPMENKSIVLNEHQITQKTERIAYQIYENTFEEKVLYIGGIAGNGFLFAERLVAALNKISDQEIRLFEISIDKDNPLNSEVRLSIDDTDLTDATCILVDDVINSGRTMIYAVRRLLDKELRVLKVATLVNRAHRRFPVQADFVGISITTTLKDNIIVELGKDEIAFLA